MADMKTLTVGGITYNIKDAGAVHTPEIARVGQTIVVKSVDESGKPTEWECVDLPSNESVLLVTITDGIASHTAAEIYAHVQSGGSAVLSGANIDFLPLASASNNACIFGGNIDIEHDLATNYVVYASKEVESFFTNYARTQNLPKTLVVTVTQEGTASHGPQDIDSHARSGGTVMFSPDDDVYIALTVCNQYMASFLSTSIEENLFEEYIIYQDGTIEIFSRTNADMDNIPTDAHINSLIDAKLGVIENGSY